jgi:putative phage-type endonuclease
MNARDNWHAQRRGGIGGSDAAAALGQHPQRTPYELFLIKTGQAPDEVAVIEDNARMRFGRVLEAVIANEYARTHDVRVRRKNVIVRHPKYPWMLANVDRLIEGRRTGLECKNVDTYGYRFGEWGEPGTDEVPTPYLLQCAHYMAVLDYDVWHLAALVGGNALRTYVIERDAALEDMMIDGEHEFWRRVESREPPPFDFQHASAVRLLKQLHPGTNGETIDLDADIAQWHTVKLDADEAMNRYKAISEGARAHILHAMGDAAVGVLPSGAGAYRRKLIERAGYPVEPCSYMDCRYIKAKPTAKGATHHE